MNALTRLTTAITTDRRAAAAAAVCAALIGILIGILVLVVTGAPRAASAEPTPCPAAHAPDVPCPNIIILGTATPPPVAEHLLSRAISAYGAPDTATLIGPVEAGRSYTPIAVSADGQWLQLDVAGSGLVWTTALSVDGVDVATLAVIATPPPTAAPPPPAAAQPEPQVIYVDQPAAPAQQSVPDAAPPTAAPSQVFPAPARTGSVEDHHPHVANPSIRPGGPNLPSADETNRAERDQERCVLASVDDDKPGGAALCAP